MSRLRSWLAARVEVLESKGATSRLLAMCSLVDAAKAGFGRCGSPSGASSEKSHDWYPSCQT
jgi:hypothetical protein